MASGVTDGAGEGAGRRQRPGGRPRRTAHGLAVVVILGALALGGCTLDESGPASAQVTNWVSGASGAAIGTLEVDSANIDHALAHHQPASAIKTVCALLTNDAETAIGNLPTPDSQLTTELNAAYEKGAAAGDDCYNGAAGNAALLRRSAAERAALVPLLTKAIHRITVLTGHTPSTSTTQPAAGCPDPFAACN